MRGHEHFSHAHSERNDTVDTTVPSDLASGSSMSNLNTASKCQASLRDRPFQYDVLSEGRLRLFKLDLNEASEPLSGALLSTYHTWNAMDWSQKFWSNLTHEDSDGIVKMLTDSKGYDTFSYTWGDQRELFPLRLSLISSKLSKDKCVRTNFEPYRNGTIQIGQNLRDLLEELRTRKHPRFVWIDAICINQANDLEKKLQIPLMRDIFEYAGNGYVWLGSGSPGETEAMTCLPQLTEQLKQVVEADLILQPGQEDTFVGANLPGPDQQIWKDLGAIMRKPYWSRIWTLQEVVVSERTTGGIFGLRTLPPTELFLGGTTTQLEILNDFCVAATSLNLRSWIVSNRPDYSQSRPATLYGFDGIEEIRLCRESWGSDFWGIGLRALLLGTRRRKATLAVDYVFGMLAMMDKHTSKDLLPALNSSTRDVYIKFAKHYVRNEHKEHLFNHVATERKIEGLPSWCPDFSAAPTTLPLGSRYIGKYEEDYDVKEQMYHAGYTHDGKFKLPRSKNYMLKSVGNVMKARIQNHGIHDTDNPRQISLVPDTDYLLVSGMHLDLVVDVVECNSAVEAADFLSLKNVLQTGIWEMQCLKLALQHLSRDVNGFDTYARTLTANRVTLERGSPNAILFDRKHTVDFLDRYRKFKEFVQQLKDSSGGLAAENNLDQETWHYADVMARMTCKRRFFATEAGRIGLGPAGTEIGDAVCVLFYCPTPYILRHWPYGRSQLVGEAYVHGLMYGEALDMLGQGDLDETQWILE